MGSCLFGLSGGIAFAIPAAGWPRRSCMHTASHQYQAVCPEEPSVSESTAKASPAGCKDSLLEYRIQSLEARPRKVLKSPEVVIAEMMKIMIWRTPRAALVLYGGSGVFDCLYEEALVALLRRIQYLGGILPLRPRHQKKIEKTKTKHDQLVKAAVAAGRAYLVMDVADVK